MSDLLSIALSGVTTYSKALDVVADNVANANTPGHVRRTTVLSSATYRSSPGPLELDRSAGAGVRLTGVARASDELRSDTLRRAEAQVGGLDTSARWLSTLQGTLTGDASMEQPLNDLFNSMSDLAADPTNGALRQIFLSKADALAQRFQQSSAALSQLQQDLQTEADTEGKNLNALALGLADVNNQLRRATPGGGTAVALLDERDRILSQMSVVTAIDVQFDNRGEATVRIPDQGGPALVAGGTANSARIVAAGAGFELRIGPTGADEQAPVTAGVVLGLSSARTKISEAQQRLDLLAERVATEFNAQQAEGVDLSGADGEPLFSLTRPLVTAARANDGAARIAATLADGATLQASTLVFDGTDWTLQNGGGAVTGPLPLTLDGLTITANGTPANGDYFEIGAAGPAAAIALRPISADQLALSSRWLSDANPANTGSGRAELAIDADLVTPATPPFTATVLAGGVIEVTDALDNVLASGNAGDWLSGDGFAIRLSGPLAEGDRFRIERAGAHEGNNGNAVAMLSIRDASNAAGTIAETTEAMVTSVTTALSEARTRLDIASRARDGAAEALQESSGVDLNTEAAEMMRLQQAYQANARIIQTSRETFDALLNATR